MLWIKILTKQKAETGISNEAQFPQDIILKVSAKNQFKLLLLLSDPISYIPRRVATTNKKRRRIRHFSLLLQVLILIYELCKPTWERTEHLQGAYVSKTSACPYGNKTWDFYTNFRQKQSYGYNRYMPCKTGRWHTRVNNLMKSTI